MDLELKEKVAFVSGSSRGIGLYLAKKLSLEGCKIILNSRNSEQLNHIKSEFLPNTSFIEGDVTKADDVDKIYRSIKDQYGKLDILVCNVGSGRSVPPGQEDRTEWERVININLFSCTNIIEKCLPLIKQARGNIVAISSICGMEVLGAPLTYSSAKAALNSYIKGLARAVGKEGIRVNGVAPGNILFPGSVWEEKLNNDSIAVKEMLKREVALNRLGKPEEIADLVSFLVSPRASFITGSIFVADGGQLRH